jgi:hypothetical protein
MITIKSHSVLTYYVLVFAISWGGFLLVGGPGFLSGTNWKTDPLFLFAVWLMVTGPPVAGILLTGLVRGNAGLRELLSRLLKWRVGVRWYVAALLVAPLLQAAILFGLSRISPVFLPAIVTTDVKANLLLSGIVAGLLGGFMEELGWTGFAIPRLRLRHSVLATGLIVGILWGAWHLLQMWWVGRTASEAIPLTLFLLQYFSLAVIALKAYRILMVWVYDRTESLLIVILMHASYIATTLFVIAPPTTGGPYLTYAWVWTISLWIVVAAVVVANRGHLSQKPLGENREHPQATLLTTTANRGSQPTWQRIILLSVLGYEGAGCLLGGSLLVAAPDGRLMEMPVEIMHGVFRDFLIPGLILIGLGILNTSAFVAVLRRARTDWLLAGLGLGGLTIWFIVEIIILRELHWLHAMWGLPVLVGGLAALPMVPSRRSYQKLSQGHRR